MAKAETTVTKLAMTVEPLFQVPSPAIAKLALMRAENPTAPFYRYLYDTVGRSLAWVDCKRLSDTELLAVIQDERVEIWVLNVAGQPAGFFEFDARGTPDTVELMYFGLIPEFHGRGLGKWLLAEAIRACWSKRPERVIVETCTLDSPMALPLYQRMGFNPYARKQKLVEIGASPKDASNP